MSKLIKYCIKKVLKKFGWKLTKIYINKSFTNSIPDKFQIDAILKSKGIIHMGAHRGTDAAVYNWFNKKVIWIESNPHIFEDLKLNTEQFFNQEAFNILLYDKDNIQLDFKISNNDSASSSIYEFGEHGQKQNVKMIKQIKLNTKKLDTFFDENRIKNEEYDFWVMDLQGSELKALMGAVNSLKNCNYILIEVSKVEYYKGGAKWEEICDFLLKNGFKNVNNLIEEHQDILFVRN